jgi:quinol monooxygenase YgiN
MSSFKPGFSVFMTAQVTPENAPKFLEAFKPVFEKMIANPECEFFELYRNPAEPGVFSWMEDW